MAGRRERLDNDGSVGRSALRCCGLNGSGETGLLRVETDAELLELEAPPMGHMRRSSAYMGLAEMGEIYLVELVVEAVPCLG